MSPYRLPAFTTVDAAPPRTDLGIAWLGSIVWLASIVRVAVSAIRREPLDEEVWLALVLILAIPWVFLRGFTKS